MAATKFTWLITGASSGLGYNIALAALNAGHGVVATARNVPKAKQDYPDIETKGGHWLKLDVTSDETPQIVREAVEKHNVNVLVNNAGYALRGVLEDLSMEAIRSQMETNFIAPLAITQACLPHFRSLKDTPGGSAIINISSTSGIAPSPGYSLYAASKFALEGSSEALSAELAPFNIRVLIVEPGGFRTNFQSVVSSNEPTCSAPYEGTPADTVAKRMRTVGGKEPGDPVKAGQAIVEVITGVSKVEGLEGKGKDAEGALRLPLGKDAVQRALGKAKSFAENVEKVRGISEWAVFEE